MLAPDKKTKDINDSMLTIRNNISKTFAPAGSSTQMIIGATKDSDKDIMTKSANMYKYFHLKRVFYSAYIPVNQDKLLPSISIPPLKRENRLYQADWLLRFYKFSVNELFDNNNNFNYLVDPKTDWALRHLEEFPKEINKVSFNELIRIPGIGITSAKKIVSARKVFKIEFKDLKNMGVSLKRAKYFITCNNKYFNNLSYLNKELITINLLNDNIKERQLSLFD